MKGIIKEFIRRGMVAMGIGPLVLAAVYLVLEAHGIARSFGAREVCLGILSLSALAFVAGGMNILYKIERLPLMAAVLLHGLVLYGAYLLTYLINGWLERGAVHILVFTAIFVLGYLAIWAVIYCVTFRNTARVNEGLKERQRKL